MADSHGRAEELETMKQAIRRVSDTNCKWYSVVDCGKGVRGHIRALEQQVLRLLTFQPRAKEAEMSVAARCTGMGGFMPCHAMPRVA